jgi:hypothetical protein
MPEGSSFFTPVLDKIAILTSSGKICIIGWICCKKDIGSLKNEKKSENEKKKFHEKNEKKNDLFIDILCEQKMLYDMKSVLEICHEGGRIFVCMEGGIDVLLLNGIFIYT